MGALSFFVNFFISSAYLIGWVLLAVGLGHNHWIYFTPDDIEVEVNPRLGSNYPCYAGLWQTCCPTDYWSRDDFDDNDAFENWAPFEDESTSEEDTIECNANAFLWANETKQVILNGGGLPGTTYLRVQIWMLRSVMLVAAGLPLFGCIAALCGNRFFGFVSICVAGMFGMTGIMLGFFFSAQYFPRDDQELPGSKLKINGEYGETVYCLMGGVACIWFFSLLDCLACSRYYRSTKKKMKKAKDQVAMSNPYADSDDSDDGISTSSL